MFIKIILFKEARNEHLEEDICMNVGNLLCNDHLGDDGVRTADVADTHTGGEDLGEGGAVNDEF